MIFLNQCSERWGKKLNTQLLHKLLQLEYCLNIFMIQHIITVEANLKDFFMDIRKSFVRVTDLHTTSAPSPSQFFKALTKAPLVKASSRSILLLLYYYFSLTFCHQALFRGVHYRHRHASRLRRRPRHCRQQFFNKYKNLSGATNCFLHFIRTALTSNP